MKVIQLHSGNTIASILGCRHYIYWGLVWTDKVQLFDIVVELLNTLT